jgi:ABC-type glycerol-3-phosphate transport system substrate-binding protein
MKPRTSGRRARGPLALVATLVVVLAVLAGQATGAGTATTLVVQDGEGGNDARISALKKLDALFMKANPGVTIKHVSK